MEKSRATLTMILVIGVGAAIYMATDSMLLALLVSFVILFAMMAIDEKAKQKEINEKVEEDRKKEENRQKDFKNKLESKDLSFVIKQIYDECKAKNIDATKIDDKYYSQKCLSIAKNVMEKNGVSKPLIDKYLTEELLLNNLKPLIETKQKEKQQKEEQERIRRHQVQNTNLNSGELDALAFNDLISSCYGLDKRITMIEHTKDVCSKECKKLLDAFSAAQELAGIVNASAYQKPKANAYAMAGLNSAIGGPLTGAIAYSETMFENAKIDAENAKNKVAVAKLANSIATCGSSKVGEYSDLKNKFLS